MCEDEERKRDGGAGGSVEICKVREENPKIRLLLRAYHCR